MPMPSPSRRGFFGFLGGALAGGKKAAEEVATKLARINDDSLGIGNHIYGPPTGRSPQSGGGNWTKPLFKRQSLKLIPEELWPEWLKIDIENNSYVDRLDFDLANSPFMSLGAKVSTQRRRNREKAKNDFFETPWRKAEKWMEEHGYDGTD